MPKQDATKRILGLIPARGGSKGLPRKNLFPIMGKPLLEFTVDAAHNSRYITQTMLSSEDQEILDFARKLGVDCRYKRPKHLATDQAVTIDAVFDVLDWLEERGELPDIVVLLQPTSPLRDEAVIDQALEMFMSNSMLALTSVHAMKDHPFKSVHKRNGEWNYLAKPKKYVSRRQDYPEEYFVINGALYIATPQWLREQGEFTIEGKTFLFETSPIVGMDVDALIDVYQIEAYLRIEQEGKSHESN